MTGNQTGHSADVKMHVVINGSEFRICQLGPDFLMLEEAYDLQGVAQVILSVDGETQSRHVQLQCGSTGNEKTISFLSIGLSDV
jgi:hypothetical protein